MLTEEPCSWADDHKSSSEHAGLICRDEIQSPACSARVQKIMEYASSDIRFDVPLAEACFEDRQEFCGNVPPGSARVIRCLQDRCPLQAPRKLHFCQRIITYLFISFLLSQYAIHRQG